MLLTLIDKNNKLDYVLPKKTSGKYVINTKDDDENIIPLITVEEEEGKWFIRSNKNAKLKDDEDNLVSKVQLQPFNKYKIFKSDSTIALLFTQNQSEEAHKFKKYTVNKEVIKIGKSKEANICFENKLVSPIHCQIKYDSGNSEATVIDCDSSNGTYVNGKKIVEKKLVVGDVIYIMGLKIVYNGNILAINNPNNAVVIDESCFNLLKKAVPKTIVTDKLEDLEEKSIEKEIFFRSPRFKKDIERREFKIDSPPAPTKGEEVPLMYMLGPSITMGMASLLTSIVTVENIISNGGDLTTALPTIFMAFSMILGTVLWPVLTKRYEKKRVLKNEEIRKLKYKNYIEEVRSDIALECEKQRRILYANNTSIYECVEMIENREINLWERIISHNDFARVRLGVGSLPIEADFGYEEKKFELEEDELKNDLYKLIDEPKMINPAPITISLLDEKATGIIGDRKSAKSLIKSIIFQLAALQGYDQLKFIFLYDEKDEEEWGFSKWLPHSWSEDKSIRFIGTNVKDVKEISMNMEKIIVERKNNSKKEIEELLPYYIIFSMSKTLEVKSEFIKSILREKENLGFSIVSLYDEIKNLPKECSTVIEVTPESAQIYDKDDISGKYIEFNMEALADVNCEDLAIKLSNIVLDDENSKNSLPEMITFLEMFKVGKIEHLNILERWNKSDPTKSIETEVGVDAMGDLFKLDLHEKFHGPHGLIAGMTGSGKSEFIITFILSLAINYHPDEVAFILIDYKGGGMANTFTNLPHVAGTITNLDGAAVKRSLISIQSELKRRQAIFSKASKDMQISNIDIYKYQKLYREGKVSEPLQHLFIISDEFAELKVQQPEFMEQLISAARIGRSLGVHLILATQKPAGVVDDQIWSNSRFRVCLKVQEKSDSMDVIKRADAAEIAETGRFYLQVGFNELFEIGQSAWSGAPYYPSNRFEVNKDESIAVIDNIGRVLRSAKIDKKAKLSKNPPKQIDEIVKYIINISKEENIKVRPIWLEPISPIIFLEDIRKKYDIEDIKYKLNPVVGEYDDPTTQSQHPLTIPISQGGNTIVYGSAESGKTTFITTLIYSLIKSHTPEEVNLYVLDFNTEILKVFEKAPHVGEVLFSYEAEKINNLFKMLYEEIEKRKKLFVDFGGDYNSYIKNSGCSIESLVIVIHNITAFIEIYEDKEEDIAYLTRECTKYGIYFVLTVSNVSGIRYKLLQNFKNIYSLQLNDSSEYVSVLGHTDGVIPSKYKGRGIFKIDKVYEFQIALSFKEVDNIFELIKSYCNKYSIEWDKAFARKIPILPQKVDLLFFEDEINHSDKFKGVPIGVEKDTLKIKHYDFDKFFVNMVLSQNQSNNSFSQGLAEVMAECTDEVIVIDAKNSFIEDKNRKYRYINDSAEFDAIAVELFNTLVQRHKEVKNSIGNNIEIKKYKNIKCIINSFNEFLKYLSEDSKDKVNVFMLNGKLSYNINFILVEDINNLSSISYEEWFSKQVSLSDGIWIGNGISEQYQLKINKITKEMYSEIGDDFGYAINDGKVKLIKVLTSVNKVQEDD